VAAAVIWLKLIVDFLSAGIREDYWKGVKINDNNDTCLMAIFQDSLGVLVLECLHSGFHWS